MKNKTRCRTGRSKPIFAAHRGYTDEPWRIDRLKSVFASATRRLGCESSDGLWDGAVRMMHDRKGTLTIVWRSEDDFRDFARVVKAAWNEHEEWTPIQHMCPAGLPFDFAVQLSAELIGLQLMDG